MCSTAIAPHVQRTSSNCMDSDEAASSVLMLLDQHNIETLIDAKAKKHMRSLTQSCFNQRSFAPHCFDDIIHLACCPSRSIHLSSTTEFIPFVVRGGQGPPPNRGFASSRAHRAETSKADSRQCRKHSALVRNILASTVRFYDAARFNPDFVRESLIGRGALQKLRQL